jgi:hypothetical protein
MQFHANNGPAYVQIQATNALARMIGLYDDAKQAVQATVDSAARKTRRRFEGVKFEGFGAYGKGEPNPGQPNTDQPNPDQPAPDQPDHVRAEVGPDDEQEEAANQEDDDVP